MLTNKKEIIQLLERIALYLELKGENPFRIAAYRKAAQALERDVRSLAEIDDISAIKGIGAGTMAVINDFIDNGTSEILTNLEQEIPEELLSLLKIPGLGGKRIAKLYKELDIIGIDSLREACEAGKVGKLAGFGEKTVENILTGIKDLNKRPERLPIANMLPIATFIESYLLEIPEIIRFSRAGSLRRMCETIKDIDYIIAADEQEKVCKALLKINRLKKIISQGKTKVSITIEDVYDVNVDFRIVTNEEYPSALHHFTGSMEHNVAMRQIAKARGERINEYGVEIEETGEILTFVNEEGFFNHFNMPYIPPEIREHTGEITTFKETVHLINEEDIRGDLHLHTTWSDGAQSIEEMVNYARKIGYDYISITDHSKFLRVANGLNETRLRRQYEEIQQLNEKYPDIHIFSGVEMDILPDGSLDFSNGFLAEMDFVIAAIHSSFNQTEEEIMSRMYAAIDNPYVSLIAHPTGRLIGRREGYQVNIDQLIDRAIETNTALEMNANPNRLDLSAEWARKAQEKGAILAINTDAHNYEMFDHMKYGIGTARKGWIKKETVINTWSKQRLIDYFNRNK